MKVQKLKIPVAVAEEMSDFCHMKSWWATYKVGKPFDTEVVFDDGRRIAIQVCCGESGGWVQAVLYEPEGTEFIGTTGAICSDDLLGEYQLEFDGTIYRVTVHTDMADAYENGECPDCGEPIDIFAVDGAECPNCGHIFWSEAESE